MESQALKNLTMKQIFDEITTSQMSILDSIPPGPKDNIHFYIRHQNYKNFIKSKKSRRPFHFQSPPDYEEEFITLDNRNDVYQIFDNDIFYASKEFKYENNDRRFYLKTEADTLRPVSDEESSNLILVRICFQKAKFNNNIFRKITYFLIVPTEFQSLHDICLVEYTGIAKNEINVEHFE